MSQRPSDESVPRMSDEAAAEFLAIGKANAWGRTIRLAALADWQRARAAEMEKDAKIQALVDALEGETSIVDLLYHSVMAGKDKATMGEALQTAERWIKMRGP